MLEAAILVVLIAGLTALGLAVWQRLRGPSRSAWHVLGRGSALFVVFVVLVGSAAWQFSNSRTLQLGGHIVQRADVTAPLVALTFDDGPNAGMVDKILPVLDSYGVKASFFLIGRDIERNMAAAQALAAAGHELGNHSYSHTRMLLKPTSFIRQEIEQTDQLIRQAGHQGEIFFRSPYCKKLFLLPLYLAQNGRTNITFDVEPDTYREVAGDPDKFAEYVLSHARPGSIILLHPWAESAQAGREALPAIIEGLQARGYRFVTVSELLAAQ